MEAEPKNIQTPSVKGRNGMDSAGIGRGVIVGGCSTTWLVMGRLLKIMSGMMLAFTSVMSRLVFHSYFHFRFHVREREK
jgi:hypothetical protein